MSKFSRGKFLKVFLAVSMSVVMAAGCPTAQQWFQIAGALLPIIGQTYLQFGSFTQAGAQNPAEVALVQTLTTAGQDILNKIGGPNGLLATYQTNQNASVITQINALLAQAQTDVNAFLTDAQIKNSARFAEYSQFAQALLADIQDVVAIIPVVTPSTPPTTTARAVPAKIVMRTSIKEASGLKAAFQARLSGLPK